MDTAELDYELPPEAIAQQPVEPRDSARLLVARAGTAVSHRHVADLADLLDPGDVLVVNDTRVIPARLLLRKPTGGAAEVLLLERRDDGWWEALVRPGRRIAPGTLLVPQVRSELGDEVEVEVAEPLGDDGRRRVRIWRQRAPLDDIDLEMATVTALGEVPLPPYIHEPLADPERYQTVFSDRPASVAAPTAGLHLTAEVLERCRQAGVVVATVDLVVGLGTFRPMTTETVEAHPMHAERYTIPPATQDLLGRRAGGDPPSTPRVVAVGTTVVRALEAWAATGRTDAATDLFIRRGHRFAMVDRLLTNFHVPRSSLLALVEAFHGPTWRSLYETALADRYRFLSFGDAMLLDRRPSDDGEIA